MNERSFREQQSFAPSVETFRGQIMKEAGVEMRMDLQVSTSLNQILADFYPAGEFDQPVLRPPMGLTKKLQL